MSDPLVSVIIPAFRQADFLGEAISSVLDQSYGNLEVIVVDDHSPDHTAAVVQQFTDPRLRYIAHDCNRMLPAARNTGLRAARGEIIALLDADDYFVREKIALHIEYLRQNPSVGISYNGRRELRCSQQLVRNLVRAPAVVDLADLVLGFPFSPSDMVMRREAIFSVELFDESYTDFSEDLDINCRLALAGWQFGGIDRCLSYRRFHAGRVIPNPRQRLQAALRSLDQTFADPRTPPEVLATKDRAYASHNVVWGVEALRGGDTASGIEFLREALRREPGLVDGDPCELTRFFVYEAAHDDTADLNGVYSHLVAQLPDEFEPVRQQAEWGRGQAWLVNAYRYLLWSSVEDGQQCLVEAARRGAPCNEAFIREVVYQLLGLERECGRQAADAMAKRLDKQFCAVFGALGDHRTASGCTSASSFAAALEMGRAIEYYNTRRYENVPGQVLRAILSSPSRALNRASLSILTRAAIRSRRPARAGDKFAAGRMRNQG
jgi:hypothetical protein